MFYSVLNTNTYRLPTKILLALKMASSSLKNPCLLFIRPNLLANLNFFFVASMNGF